MHLLGCLDRPTSGVAAGRRPRRRRAVRRRARRPAQPHDRLRLPVLPAARPHHRAGQRRAAAGLPRRAAGRAARARAEAALEPSGSGTGWGTARLSCPAASSSGSPSPARWWGSRRCCWPTSRPATSTPRSGAEVMALLGRLNAERGVAVVVVTHDLEVAGFRRRWEARTG